MVRDTLFPFVRDDERRNYLYTELFESRQSEKKSIWKNDELKNKWYCVKELKCMTSFSQNSNIFIFTLDLV